LSKWEISSSIDAFMKFTASMFQYRGVADNWRLADDEGDEQEGKAAEPQIIGPLA